MPSAAPPTEGSTITAHPGALRWVIRLALLLYWSALIATTYWPGLTEDDVPDWGWLPFDKAMHAITFTGLGMLLTWAGPRPRGSAKTNAVVSFVIGLTYGAVKELTQSWFGRTGSWADLLADAVGLTIGCTTGWAVWRLVQRGAYPSITRNRSETPVTQKEDSGGGGGFVGHAKLVGLMTLVSRMTGLVRDAVLAAVFGATLYLDALLIGFLVPNLFRRLFGEGALTAAFIPRYTKLLREDPALARRFASLCVVVVASLLAGLTLVGEAGLWFAWLNADSEKAGLALRLTMWMLPYMPMVCGVAFLGAMLQVHKRFGPPAAAPIVLNLVMTAAAWSALSRAGSEWSGVFTVAVSVLIAGLLQLAWMGTVVLRTAPLTGSFRGTRGHFRGMMVTMLPMVIGLGVFQINTLLDGLIAYGFAAPAEIIPAPGAAADLAAAQALNLFGRTVDYPMQTGAVTTLTLAQRLYQFPLGVFGIAIATAIFPALAAAASSRTDHAKPQAAYAGEGHSGGGGGSGSEGGGEFADIFRRGLRLTFFIGLPASVGLILVRVPLTRVFFEWNAFT
ncbi:MAG: VanZ family protein, partial [Planctomycetota bacterium]